MWIQKHSDNGIRIMGAYEMHKPATISNPLLC